MPPAAGRDLNRPRVAGRTAGLRHQLVTAGRAQPFRCTVVALRYRGGERILGSAVHRHHRSEQEDGAEAAKPRRRPVTLCIARCSARVEPTLRRRPSGTCKLSRLLLTG